MNSKTRIRVKLDYVIEVDSPNIPGGLDKIMLLICKGLEGLELDEDLNVEPGSKCSLKRLTNKKRVLQ